MTYNRKAVILLSVALLYCQDASAQLWSYSALAQWGGSCQNGTLQSPLNLRADMNALQQRAGSPVTLNYSTSVNLTSQRTSSGTQQLLVPPGSNITINGSEYKVLHMHWHVPSEHAVNGRHGAAELHIVHNDAASKLAVIGVIYTRGVVTDPLLQVFLDHVPPVVPQGQAANGSTFGPVNLRALVNNLIPNGTTGSFLTYTGSLTTPPCTEGVRWLLSSRNTTITDTQILALEDAIGDEETLGTNSRPVQAGSPSQQVTPL